MLKKVGLILVFLSLPLLSIADIYQYLDDDGVPHFTDNPNGEENVSVIAHQQKSEKSSSASPRIKAEPVPVPGEYLMRGASASDGSIWAVKKTNKYGYYYWYMGPSGKYLAKVNKDKSISLSFGSDVTRITVVNGEITASDPDGSSLVWLEGTLGYKCYSTTIEDTFKK